MMASPQMLSFPVLATYVIFAALILREGVESSCFPDQKELCDAKGRRESSWNTTMRFFLFTRSSYEAPEMMHMCNGRLPKYSYFNPKNRLVVFIPGFMFGVCELVAIREIKDELLAKEDMNVLLIDDRYEVGIDIVDAKKRLPEIAKVIVKVLQNIQDMTGIENDKVYILGHSLGAQVAGIVGSLFKVHRITGLDPAGVLFTEETPLAERLDSSDANLVDIIHCNGGPGLPYLAVPFPTGHADFYVNGGSNQPTCSHSAWEAIKHFNILFALGATAVPTLCAHAQCLEFYKLSINNKLGNFTAWRCDNYDDFKNEKCTRGNVVTVPMGYDFEKHFTQELRQKPFLQKYYVQTSDTWPFFTNNGTYRSGR